jgi:hypothetical protein
MGQQEVFAAHREKLMSQLDDYREAILQNTKCFILKWLLYIKKNNYQHV